MLKKIKLELKKSKKCPLKRSLIFTPLEKCYGSDNSKRAHPPGWFVGQHKCPVEMNTLGIDWMLNPSNEFHLDKQAEKIFFESMASHLISLWKGGLGLLGKKINLHAADVRENEPAFLPLDTLLWEEWSPGARKRSKSIKPTVKCCSYTLFSHYVLAPFKTGSCPDVELQPFDHPNPLPCGRFCNSDSDCGLNNPLRCCASSCGTLCRHPGELS